MGRTSAATSAVIGALGELRNTLSERLPPPSRGWSADTTAFRRAWDQLQSCIHDANDIIMAPQSGQGIELVLLRAVCMAVSDVKTTALQSPNGVDDVVRHGSPLLDLLVSDFRCAGEELMRGANKWKGDVSQLLEPQQTPLLQIRAWAASPVAKLWAQELRLFVTRRKLTYDIARRVGELVLQAVDSLTIDTKLLNDWDFLLWVVRSIDYPEYFSLEWQEQATDKGLLSLANWLDPNHNNENATASASTGAQKSAVVTIVINGKSKSYSRPKNYKRDEWIYENIILYDRQTLSELLKEHPSSKKWKIISSRNALKNAAKKYANFHEIEEHKFTDDRVLGNT